VRRPSYSASYVAIARKRRTRCYLDDCASMKAKFQKLQDQKVPPYFTPAKANLCRSVVALVSSIQSGCFQCSFGITPNSTADEFATILITLLHKTELLYVFARRREYSRLELFTELDVIQEHIGVPVLPIESIFQLADATHSTVQFRIPNQHDNGGIRASLRLFLFR
jgi:hypothetical protein